MEEVAPSVLDRLSENRRSIFDHNLTRVISKALEKRVEARYQSVDEMHEAVYSCLVDRGEAVYRSSQLLARAEHTRMRCNGGPQSDAAHRAPAYVVLQSPFLNLHVRFGRRASHSASFQCACLRPCGASLFVATPLLT